ncbi:tRNA-specific adenosine deaminase [Corticibacter populi]|uniref:tRNA-specific adenosine deaminase n=1 Tax=Corticibacter populi TaxID=1550736 RepID=A0A3M6QZ79_9BURK|nr:tRNA adenosine(34) deaminase TadA [Corticibacter populi]RMX08334.1 tRNA-specific adenosine deaminase [Corticibacter populi]RZS35624.1 tRNA(adenine34) deaminase [Corticibacter populi]
MDLPTDHIPAPYADRHARWMDVALQQARQAAAEGEVPVGAVVVCDDELLASDHNRTLQNQDPTAHAEVLALRAAAHRLGNHRLQACSLYVTLEPCAMCSGAIFQARLREVVFGAAEPKTGAAGSVVDLFANPVLNHQTQIVRGVRAGEASRLLADFFLLRRAQQAGAAVPLRDDALRTPPICFADCPSQGAYVQDLPSLQGLRMHFQSTWPGAQAWPAGLGQAYLLLHPLWHWSAHWQGLLEELARQGASALAPDLIGWGRSDKPKKVGWHQLDVHAHSLLELLERLQAPRLTLVAQDQARGLALRLRQLAPQRFVRLVTLQAPLATGLLPLTDARLRARSWHMLQHLQAHVPGLSAAGLQQACAPYPDAGHWKAWASAALLADADSAVPGEAVERIDVRAEPPASWLAAHLLGQTGSSEVSDVGSRSPRDAA